MVAHVCPSIWEGQVGNAKFKDSLGYIVRPCLNKQTKSPTFLMAAYQKQELSWDWLAHVTLSHFIM
jgi:hypothetical protein